MSGLRQVVQASIQTQTSSTLRLPPLRFEPLNIPFKAVGARQG
jgi:hypothetical protein